MHYICIYILDDKINFVVKMTSRKEKLSFSPLNLFQKNIEICVCPLIIM